jgi:restriction-modification enzyme MmeI-like protein
LDVRVKYPVSSLADFYNRSMPPDLVKARQKLDAAVDAAFSKKKFSSDTDYVTFLFELYQQILPG